MSGNSDKKKKNDEITKLWFRFRDSVNKKLSSESKAEQPGPYSNFEHRLAEAQQWISGDHFIPATYPDMNESEFFEQKPIIHDQACPIFLAKGYEEKVKMLLTCIAEDPRWIFDPCAVNLFFNAADDSNFNFFKNLGTKLSQKNSLKNTAKNDLDNLRWFVFKRVPSYFPHLFSNAKDRETALRHQLKRVYSELLLIIQDNVELTPLRNLPSLASEKRFLETSIKWYTFNDYTANLSEE